MADSGEGFRRGGVQRLALYFWSFLLFVGIVWGNSVRSAQQGRCYLIVPHGSMEKSAVEAAFPGAQITEFTRWIQSFYLCVENAQQILAFKRRYPSAIIEEDSLWRLAVDVEREVKIGFNLSMRISKPLFGRYSSGSTAERFRRSPVEPLELGISVGTYTQPKNTFVKPEDVKTCTPQQIQPTARKDIEDAPEMHWKSPQSVETPEEQRASPTATAATKHCYNTNGDNQQENCNEEENIVEMLKYLLGNAKEEAASALSRWIAPGKSMFSSYLTALSNPAAQRQIGTVIPQTQRTAPGPARIPISKPSAGPQQHTSAPPIPSAHKPLSPPPTSNRPPEPRPEAQQTPSTAQMPATNETSINNQGATETPAEAHIPVTQAQAQAQAQEETEGSLKSDNNAPFSSTTSTRSYSPLYKARSIPEYWYRSNNLGRLLINNGLVANPLFRILGLTKVLSFTTTSKALYSGAGVSIAFLDVNQAKCGFKTQFSEMLAGELSISSGASLKPLNILNCDGTVRASQILKAFESHTGADITVLAVRGRSQAVDAMMDAIGHTAIVIQAAHGFEGAREGITGTTGVLQGKESTLTTSAHRKGTEKVIKVGGVTTMGSFVDGPSKDAPVLALSDGARGGSGTGYATLLVASATALFLEGHRQASSDEVYDFIIKNSAVDSEDRAYLRLPIQDVGYYDQSSLQYTQQTYHPIWLSLLLDLLILLALILAVIAFWRWWHGLPILVSWRSLSLRRSPSERESLETGIDEIERYSRAVRAASPQFEQPRITVEESQPGTPPAIRNLAQQDGTPVQTIQDQRAGNRPIGSAERAVSPPTPPKEDRVLYNRDESAAPFKTYNDVKPREGMDINSRPGNTRAQPAPVQPARPMNYNRTDGVLPRAPPPPPARPGTRGYKK